MASGRELCYLLLSGIMCCYLMAIPILAKPNIFTCALLRIGLGFALCLCYSSILTKTNRISRIFNRGAKGIKRPSYTSPKSQIIICCGIFPVFLSFLELLFVGFVGGFLLCKEFALKQVQPYRLRLLTIIFYRIRPNSNLNMYQTSYIIKAYRKCNSWISSSKNIGTITPLYGHCFKCPIWNVRQILTDFLHFV